MVSVATNSILGGAWRRCQRLRAPKQSRTSLMRHNMLLVSVNLPIYFLGAEHQIQALCEPDSGVVDIIRCLAEARGTYAGLYVHNCEKDGGSSIHSFASTTKKSSKQAIM